MSSTGPTRIPVTVDRLIVLGVVALLGIAACAATDGPDGAPAPATPGPDAEADPITIVTTPSTSPSTTVPATTTTPTTTSTVAPTTTVSPTVEVVARVCDSLRSDGLETRRVVVGALAEAFTSAGGDGDGRAEVAAECGEELVRLDGAVAIRSRVEAIDMAEEDEVLPVTLAGFSCDAGTFGVEVTNDTGTPVGVHANFAMYVDGETDDSVQSSLAPIVVWSIDPGATERVDGDFVDSPRSQVSCNFEGHVFDADPSPAGAAINAQPEYPELTGDDPDTWFPALYEFERAARAAGDIDAVASLVDVRSMSYDETALAISEGEELDEAELIEVCERGRSRPDADHIGFVYLERLANGRQQLSHGLFRRGFDGQWRWLGFARYYESASGNDCFTVDPDPS